MVGVAGSGGLEANLYTLSKAGDSYLGAVSLSLAGGPNVIPFV